MDVYFKGIFNFYCQKQVKTTRSLIVLLDLKDILNDDGLIILYIYFIVTYFFGSSVSQGSLE